jgi:phage gp29-like protein
MSTNAHAATSCDPHHPDPAAADPLAAAIATGQDLGVFELCSAVAKAREAIPLSSCPRTPAARQAAIGILAAFEKVRTTIDQLKNAELTCPCCDLRRQLDQLIQVAAKADATGPLAEACEELANYAGDLYPDADAIRYVLELARDVFVAAIADRLRDE